MLAQNFKSAADLNIGEEEHSALVKVLGMLERGELVDVHFAVECDNGFHMGVSGHGCGTPACIGGWAAAIMGIDQCAYTERYDLTHKKKNPALHELFWNEAAVDTPAKTFEAVAALRSYLTTGDARWDLAMTHSSGQQT